MNKKLYILLLLVLTGSIAVYSLDIDTNQINSNLLKALSLQQENPDSSYNLAKAILASSTKANYDKGIAGAYMRLGSILNSRGQNDSALWYTREAFMLRKKMKDYSGAARSCISLSYIYKEISKKDSAFAVLFESLRMSKLAGDSSMLLGTYLELGNLSVSYNDHEDALQYFHQAINIGELSKDTVNLCHAYGGLGNFYFSENEFHQALHYFQQKDSLLTLISDPVEDARNKSNIGSCYEGLKNYTRAKQYYFLSLQEHARLNMRLEEAVVSSNLGNLFIHTNMPDSAIFYVQKAYFMLRDMNNLQQASICLEYLADAWAMKGDFAKAYKYHTQYNALKDSLMEEEKITIIEETKAKYKTELKDQQIKLLNEQNLNKIKQRNIFITASLLLVFFLWLIIRQHTKVRKEKRESERLLLNILPSEVAEELKQTGEAVAKQYNHVSVLFTDFVNFTGISEQMSPTELVAEIHQCFTAFDAIIERNGLEKIKTIGDAYMAVCGLPNEDEHHALKVTLAATEIISWMTTHHSKFKIRIGINSGPVVAGIVGVKKFAYDIWGDTVNTAARMEQHSEADKINISDTTYALVGNHFNCVYRGKVTAKNKGEIDMYFVEGQRDSLH